MIPKLALCGVLLSIGGLTPARSADSNEEILTRLKAIEERLDRIENEVAPQLKKQITASVVDEERKKAAERAKQDTKHFTRHELQGVEALYQGANRKLDQPESLDALRKLVDRYPKANRAGCAALYLGQRTRGDEQIQYLRMAIDDYGDCYYGNGVNVGAYAKLILAYRLRKDGMGKESEDLFDQIRSDHSRAIDHQGNLLLDRIK